ncbi:MAG: hypothetical protein HWN79_17450 [Candidatus Lokiarchaeota archaeon]|nr:hypothetical protein [Candidatus Lokiarchaeota archaeon]
MVGEKYTTINERISLIMLLIAPGRYLSKRISVIILKIFSIFSPVLKETSINPDKAYD